MARPQSCHEGCPMGRHGHTPAISSHCSRQRSGQSVVMTAARSLAVAAVLGLGLALGACSPFAGLVADHWPRWAGGMPDDVPPRPGAPGYDEFIAHGQANKQIATPPGPDAKATEADRTPPAPSTPAAAA